MTHIRTIAGAAEEIKKLDPHTAITERCIRQLVNEQRIPAIAVGKRKLIKICDVLSYFGCCNTAN